MRIAPRLALALGLAALASCSSGDDHKRAPGETPETPPSVVLPDAAVAQSPTPEVPRYEPPPARGDEPATRDHRRIQIMLMSTPSDAVAAVDGKVVGRTPTYWEGDFTGRAREFTFVRPGYTMARYQFVPIQNGFVHGRLEKVGDGDAGVPEIPAPHFEPPPPPAPAPIDAGPAPVYHRPTPPVTPAPAVDAGVAPTPAPDAAPPPVDAQPGV